MLTDAQRRAQNKYRREKVKSLTFRFYPKDEAIVEWIKSQENSTGYIRELVIQDMKSKGQFKSE